MFKIGQNVNGPIQGVTSAVTPQQPEEAKVKQTPVLEPLVQAHSTEYASSLIGERRMSNLAIEFSLRNKLDAQLISFPTKIPEVPTTLPAGNAEGPTGNVGIGAPGEVDIGKGQSGLQSDPASIIPTPLGLNSEPGPEVKLLQMELNKWRTQNGQEPIDVTGSFSKDTETALKEFQQANNIKDDGIFGPITKHHMILENNHNFQQLPESDKNAVRQRMLAFGSAEPLRRQAVVDIATRPEFLSCQSSIARNNALDHIEMFADDYEPAIKDITKYLDIRSQMAVNENFRGLSAERRNQIDEKSREYIGVNNPPAMEMFQKLVTSDGFSKLNGSQEDTAIEVFNGVRALSQSAIDNFQATVDSIQNSDVVVKSRVTDAAWKNKTNGSAIEQLKNLVTNPLFQIATPEQQKAFIDAFEMMFPGEIPILGEEGN